MTTFYWLMALLCFSLFLALAKINHYSHNEAVKDVILKRVRRAWTKQGAATSGERDRIAQRVIVDSYNQYINLPGMESICIVDGIVELIPEVIENPGLRAHFLGAFLDMATGQRLITRKEAEKRMRAICGAKR